MGIKAVSFTCLVVAVLCLNAPLASAWGTYFCDLEEQGLQKIGEVCSQSYSSTRSPLTGLEEKMEKVLEFMEEIKTVEDSWFHLTKKSGTVERDLSQHEEETLEDKIRDREDGGDEEEDKKEEKGDEASKKETYDRDRSEEEHRVTRVEYDHPQTRRNRTSGEERRERGDERRESRYDWQERRNNRYDGRNRRERTSEEREESREEEVRGGKRDDATGLKRGECKSIVMDNHETIGMFYMMSYQHGHCANRNPIREPVRYCLGYCTTKTFIEREDGIWSQASDCNSCQPVRFETIRIPLSCDDGFTFEKKFQNVVDCSCRRCKAVIDSAKRH